MQALRALEIRSACESLVNRYCHCWDAGDTDAFVALFTEDGTWRRPVGDFRGHTAIRACMQEGRAQIAEARHVMDSIQIDVIDENTACGLSYGTIYHAAVGSAMGPVRLARPAMVVDYRDTFQCVDGVWRFALRHTTIVFLADTRIA